MNCEMDCHDCLHSASASVRRASGLAEATQTLPSDPQPPRVLLPSIAPTGGNVVGETPKLRSETP
jgi:hypothetical protein